MTFELYSFAGVVCTLAVIWVFERENFADHWRDPDNGDDPMLRAYVLIFLLACWPLVVIYNAYRFYRDKVRHQNSSDSHSGRPRTGWRGPI